MTRSPSSASTRLLLIASSRFVEPKGEAAGAAGKNRVSRVLGEGPVVVSGGDEPAVALLTGGSGGLLQQQGGQDCANCGDPGGPEQGGREAVRERGRPTMQPLLA